MKLHIASAAAIAAALIGSGVARAEDNSPDSGGHAYDRAGRLADRSAGRAEGGRRQADPERQDQTAARVPHRALRPCSRRAPYGGRPAGRRDLRRHAQEQDLGGDRSLARGRRGGGVEVKEFAPTLAKRLPNGPCFSKDGFLYVVEQNRVLQYPAAEFFYEGQDVAVSVVVPEGAADPEVGGELQPYCARMPRRA